MLETTRVDRPTPISIWRPRPDEMERARRVQSGLLARNAFERGPLHGLALCVPARGVGGDFFDFLHPAPGRTSLVLGDVSGKGVPAAIMMASLQALLRSHAVLAPGDLARQLESVNALFYECTEPQHYTTLFVGELDEPSGILRYANCGHLPPLVHSPGAGVTSLGATATVLGLFPDWTCRIAEHALAPGETLLAFTDGVTEARDVSGVEYGEERLADALERAAGLPLPSVVDTLLDEVRTFTRGRLGDDVTLLALRSATDGSRTIAGDPPDSLAAWRTRR